jgi:hypothetical protein
LYIPNPPLAIVWGTGPASAAASGIEVPLSLGAMPLLVVPPLLDVVPLLPELPELEAAPPLDEAEPPEADPVVSSPASVGPVAQPPDPD